MKLFLVVSLVLASVLISAAQESTPPPPSINIITDSDGGGAGLAVTTSLINAIINSETLQNKLQRIYNLIDLKIRFYRLMRTLATRENFVLLRQILDFVGAACNFIIKFLPEPSPDDNFLSRLFPAMPFESPATTMPPPLADEFDELNSAATVERVSRDAKLTEEDEQNLEKYRDDVLQLARLIYKTD